MNSGRSGRKTTALKRKSNISGDKGNSQNSPSSQHKRQKLMEDDFKMEIKVKAKRGRPAGRKNKPKQNEHLLLTSSKDGEGTDATIVNVHNQRLSSGENERSPKAASKSIANSIGQLDTEKENLKNFNLLKYNSLSKTPSPIVLVDISGVTPPQIVQKGNSFSETPSPIVVVDIYGSASPQIIDNEELLAFLSTYESNEMIESRETVFPVNYAPSIERLEKSPSRFFECPLCYKVFIDGDLARSHLANICPKLN